MNRAIVKYLTTFMICVYVKGANLFRYNINFIYIIFKIRLNFCQFYVSSLYLLLVYFMHSILVSRNEKRNRLEKAVNI